MQDESRSITNQKELLERYAKENNLNIYDVYVDDGYSGTNFERPDFKRMIRDIENKKVNMVIVKDSSRLGRDYIQFGEYIEKYFPQNNVRVISILDNYDSELDNCVADTLPFRVVMNDYYAKDTSKKVRSTKQKNAKLANEVTKGGYYIARYEAGVEGTTTSDTNATYTISGNTFTKDSTATGYLVSKAGVGVWNQISRSNALTISQAMYSSNISKFKSDLISSYAWDTAIVFIEKCGTNSNAALLFSPLYI